MPPRSGPLCARALAKINLHLEVHARQPDGYHDLTTVFQATSLTDLLRLEPIEGPFELVCTDSALPADPTNLVWRAAAAAAAEWRRSLDGIRVTLEKRIPMQSGLGGGSADAMAMLRALASWWEIEVEADALARIGRPLGADVPFFAVGGTALGLGRGDRLQRLADVPSRPVLLVSPAVGVGTADAYRWVAESREGAAAAATRGDTPEWPREPAGWKTVLPRCWNDFEPVVAARHPIVAEVVGVLMEGGAALALLSGSGSAIAALFPLYREEAVHAAMRDLLQMRRGLKVRLARTVTAEEYAAATRPFALADAPPMVAADPALF